MDDGGGGGSAGPSRKCTCAECSGKDRAIPSPPPPDISRKKCKCSGGSSREDLSSAETSSPDLAQSKLCICRVNDPPSLAETSCPEEAKSSAVVCRMLSKPAASSSRAPPAVLVQIQSGCPCASGNQTPPPSLQSSVCAVCGSPQKPPRRIICPPEPICDDEFFSLSSSEYDQMTVKEIATCDADYCPQKLQKRNEIVLSLLSEVVHLLTDDNISSEICETKICNIGAYEHGRPEDGAFASGGFKITFTASGKDTSTTCSRPCTDNSDAAFAALVPQHICVMGVRGGAAGGRQGAAGEEKPAPNAMEIQNFNDENMGDVTPVTVKPEPADDETQEDSAPVINDPDIIEEAVAPKEETPTVEEAAAPKEETPTVGVEIQMPKTEDEEPTVPTSEAFPNSFGRCICDTMCVCPVHGPVKTVPLNDSCVCPEEEAMGADSQCDPSCAEPGIEECDDEDGGGIKNIGSCCDCCHCRAMRANPCRTIATQEQAMEGGSSSNEFKFFIDSILMDLDAMENVRRAKKAQQNICPPPRPSICPRQSFPVTITEVTDLGTSSLYVKWCIHDCYGIAGYEIYVDNFLTNRYFHCNHTAAVVCDVDVMTEHKIVLIAQPKLDDVYAELCADKPGGDKCKTLLRKSDIEKGDSKECNPGQRSSVWIASIYMYDPYHKQEATPIMRRSA